jgi:hypothetical protein
MFGPFRKLFGSKGVKQIDYCDVLRQTILSLQEDVANWKGQANVDATENLILKKKLHEIRITLGKDDECFSRFTRKQIENMSIEEFRQVESEIDKDVADGKLFLS